MSLPRTLPAALACAALAVLAGCGSGGDGSGSSAAPTSAGAAASSAIPTPTKDDALAAKVPQSVSADGKIVFGTDASYPPNEFTAPDGTTIVGMDVDLGTAVAQKLGLTAEFQNSAFPGIIPGIQGGKYELGMSSFSVNSERIQTVDMVSYFSAGTQWAAKAGNPQDVDPDNACGRPIAVQRGTVQVDDITARSAACEAAGDEPITINQFEGQDEATASVVSGRNDAVLSDSPVVAYAVQQTNGQLELLGDIYDSAPYGYVVAKDQTEFADAIAQAVAALIEDGSYQQVLEAWGVEAGGIDDPTVNPAP